MKIFPCVEGSRVLPTQARADHVTESAIAGCLRPRAVTLRGMDAAADDQFQFSHGAGGADAQDEPFARTSRRIRACAEPCAAVRRLQRAILARHADDRPSCCLVEGPRREREREREVSGPRRKVQQRSESGARRRERADADAGADGGWDGWLAGWLAYPRLGSPLYTVYCSVTPRIGACR